MQWFYTILLSFINNFKFLLKKDDFHDIIFKNGVWGENMSKIGFRREILGFNREDVVEYIRKTQKETSNREKELVSSLDKLNKRNAELIDELNIIPELEAKLKISEATVEKLAAESYNLEQKKLEAEKLSQDIAKMYLVAKANAESIKKSSKQSYELAFYEIKQTLDSLENMHSQLNDIKTQVNEASNKYQRDLENIFISFENAKNAIDNISNQVTEINESALIKE